MSQPRSDSHIEQLEMSRRLYLTMKAMDAGADVFAAMEAVASTAIEHPEWDMAEEHTWAEWEAEGEAGR